MLNVFKARLTTPRQSHSRGPQQVVVRATGAELRLGSPALCADPEVDLVAGEGAVVLWLKEMRWQRLGFIGLLTLTCKP